MSTETGGGGGTVTVGGVLDRAVRQAADRPALVDQARRYPYAELDRAANRAARALREVGVGPGVRVAASLPNRTEIVVAFLGAMRLGAVWLGVPTALAPPEKAYLLHDSGVQVLLADPERAEQLAPHRAELPALRETVLVDPDGWDRLLAAADPAPVEVAVDPYAPAAIAYTSGTTGFPKGVVHSQYNLTLPGAALVGSGQAPADWRYGVCLPLTQLNLMVCMVLLAFRATGTAVVFDRRDPEGVAAAVRDERVSTLSVPSTILQGLVDHPAVAPEDLATLVHPIAGGTSCPTAIKERFRRRFGHEVYVRYGLTEAPTTVAAEPPAGEPAAAPDYVGRVLPHLSVTIVDEQGTPQPPGTTGEICLGPATGGRWAGAYRPMLGYLNQPEATAQRLAGGLLHTGDVGRVDETGNLYVSGRRHELILRGGANVYPAEVERVLASHPAVAHCAVLGRPDPRLGERVVAFVQPADGQPAPDPEALQAHCGGQLARYKVPAELRFLPELPRNALGKIDKPALRELLAASPA